jgi:rRNA maturation RNase YbeY
VKLTLIDRREYRSDEDLWRPDGALWELLRDLCAPLAREDAAASVVLVDDAEMAALNLRYRDGSGPTDVLSFAYLQAEGAGICALAAGEGWAFRDLWLDTAEAGDAGPREIGEIVIAPAFVSDRCRRRGWDTDDEWALLTVHGALHLLGWEHDTAAQTRAMRTAETEVLARRDVAHPLHDESAED